MQRRISFARAAAFAGFLLANGSVSAQLEPVAEGAIRVATFNTALNRGSAGQLAEELMGSPSNQALAVVEVLRLVRPDVVLLNEVDHDEDGRAVEALLALLSAPGDLKPLTYPHRFTGAVNTGQPTGLDLDRDGVVGGPADAQAWGAFPGQYGMVVLSMLPLDVDAARTFRTMRWLELPDALLPADHYGEFAPALFLSSKSHWDLPVLVGDRRFHVWASHPTPPTFDGDEDRNGRRNADEIRFWLHYLDAGDGPFPLDDRGRAGGAEADRSFVILGDLNADPFDGDSRPEGLSELLADARIQDPLPKSAGGVEAASDQGGANANHGGDPAVDTADFRDRPAPGNLRVDYALPSADLEVVGAGVFWPAVGEPGAEAAKRASDHRLVWVDLRLE